MVRAVESCSGSDVAVGTVIGFPHGNHLTATKVFEAQAGADDGAIELDMVIQIGALKSGRDGDVEADIAAVVELGHAAGAHRQGHLRERLPDRRREDPRLPRLSEAAGADFVKTSTGFAPGGATHDDLRLMRPNGRRPASRSRRPAESARSTRCSRSWPSA